MVVAVDKHLLLVSGRYPDITLIGSQPTGRMSWFQRTLLVLVLPALPSECARDGTLYLKFQHPSWTKTLGKA